MEISDIDWEEARGLPQGVLEAVLRNAINERRAASLFRTIQDIRDNPVPGEYTMVPDAFRGFPLERGTVQTSDSGPEATRLVKPHAIATATTRNVVNQELLDKENMTPVFDDIALLDNGYRIIPEFVDEDENFPSPPAWYPSLVPEQQNEYWINAPNQIHNTNQFIGPGGLQYDGGPKILIDAGNPAFFQGFSQVKRWCRECWNSSLSN